MSVYQKPNGKWIVDIVYEYPDGALEPRIRKVSPIHTKRGAEAYEREIRQLLASGQYHKQKEDLKDIPTLEAFQEQFIAWHENRRDKPSGIELKRQSFRCYLIPLFGSKQLDKFSVVDEDKLMVHMRSLSRSSYNNAACALNAALHVAMRKGIISKLPHKFKTLKRAKRIMPFYDFEEYESVLEAAKRIGSSCYVMCRLGGDAGLRLGEILALEWTDCDLRRGIIQVQRGIWKGRISETKGFEPRAVPMTQKVLAALKAHRHLIGPRVLYNDKGKEAKGGTLRRWLAPAQKLANLPKSTGAIHILRHTFCSHLAMRGASVLSIQKLAGHKHLSTTMLYMHLAPSEATRAIQLLDEPKPSFLEQRHPGGTAASGN